MCYTEDCVSYIGHIAYIVVQQGRL